MKTVEVTSLEGHFKTFREQTIGENNWFTTPYGKQKVLYADCIASGRLYAPIENKMAKDFGPMVANPHSFSSETGKASTYAYRHARQIIKKHVNAGKDDVLVATGTGMTSLLSRLQRIMKLRFPDCKEKKALIPEAERPVVFISHMEHHSNHVPWMETIADVVVVPCNGKQLVCPNQLEEQVNKYADRSLKIGAFTACSNVTGIITPYEELAKVMHKHNGYCIMDFAASAPYVKIDMHPKDPNARLDAVLFSPHKFLGGPGSCGVLVFNKELYHTEVPDVPGGGNVKWTNPWGEFSYSDDIEIREDGGTPGFLQVIRAALAMQLKDKMGVENIEAREKELLQLCFTELGKIPGMFILGDTKVDRIGCVSFGIEGIHYNLMVRLLNDRFGIQVRGGWSCASTYGHHLFNLDEQQSKNVTDGINCSNLTDKPGWVRISLHPTLTNDEVAFICKAVAEVTENINDWEKDYTYNPKTNEFDHHSYNDDNLIAKVASWF